MTTLIFFANNLKRLLDFRSGQTTSDDSTQTFMDSTPLHLRKAAEPPTLIIMTEAPNWFSFGQLNFAEILRPDFGKPGYSALQVGAFAGHASWWLVMMLLNGEGSSLDDVDTWLGSDEEAHHRLDFSLVEAEYDNRVGAWLTAGKIRKHKMTSDEFFAQGLGSRYDFIYIDGDHHAAQVYKDGANAHPLLKSGGILAFDDLTWSAGTGNDADDPAPGIRKFQNDFGKNYEVLTENTQLWLRRL